MKNESTKHEKIVQAAVEVIRDKGFEKTSVSQIVKHAGVAQGTFYLYFQSKNELVPAIAETILKEQLTRMKETYSTKPLILEELLQSLVDVSYDLTKEYKKLITFIYSGMAFYHSFETWDNIYKPYYEWLEVQFKELRSKSLLTDKGSIPYLANFTVGLVEHGAESFYLSHASAGDPNRSKKELVEFLTKALSN
ncbi:TetR family transcriptional regulator [Salipaludibacillus keqinensis]|nr:TetR family transcriptional regulator [Salipaludibacillus keqinensis]